MDDFFPDVPDQDDIGFDFDEATLIAREKFGVPFLFPWQRFVIANIVDSVRLCEEQPDFCDNEDDELYCRGRQIVLLPTGSGKSMCFLVPAMMLPGATLVFYPLLALMADQKRRMEEAGIQCAVFKGGQTAAERAENFSLLSAGAKVILANPEVLQNDGLLARLSSFKISHVAIDEAHCVFEWGSSFRPAYLQIAKIISRLGARVVTAFTATASPAVLGEIGNIIFGGHFHLLKSESDRANIHYSLMLCVREGESRPFVRGNVPPSHDCVLQDAGAGRGDGAHSCRIFWQGQSAFLSRRDDERRKKRDGAVVL